MAKKDPLALSAQDIISIGSSFPEKVFNFDTFDYEQRKMRSKWHPDHGADEDVARIVRALIENGQKLIADGTWPNNVDLRFVDTKTNKQFVFRGSKIHEIDVGKMIISPTKVAFVVDEANTDLFNTAIRAIKSIRYKNAKFNDEFSKFMPKVLYSGTTNIGNVCVFEKPTGYYCLQDVLDELKQPLDPKHVCWIVSSLYNLATFFDVHGICHNGITTTSVFINPTTHPTAHTTMILGGWWYSAQVDKPLVAIPAQLRSILPSEVFDAKIAKTSYDRLAIKALAIKALGDPTMIGSKLLIRKDIPKPMLNWLRSPSLPSAIDEYTKWYSVLEQGFGKRKFTKFEHDLSNLYT